MKGSQVDPAPEFTVVVFFIGKPLLYKYHDEAPLKGFPPGLIIQDLKIKDEGSASGYIQGYHRLGTPALAISFWKSCTVKDGIPAFTYNYKLEGNVERRKGEFEEEHTKIIKWIKLRKFVKCFNCKSYMSTKHISLGSNFLCPVCGKTFLAPTRVRRLKVLDKKLTVLEKKREDLSKLDYSLKRQLLWLVGGYYNKVEGEEREPETKTTGSKCLNRPPGVTHKPPGGL